MHGIIISTAKTQGTGYPATTSWPVTDASKATVSMEQLAFFCFEVSQLPAIYSNFFHTGAASCPLASCPLVFKCLVILCPMPVLSADEVREEGGGRHGLEG